MKIKTSDMRLRVCSTGKRKKEDERVNEGRKKKKIKSVPLLAYKKENI